CQQYDNWNTF
nr:immunoglobulin light chain junction region [Macaca mulatta]